LSRQALWPIAQASQLLPTPVGPMIAQFSWAAIQSPLSSMSNDRRSPATGESFWYLATGVDKELFEATLALFAREAGAGRDRIIILVLDGAGWHTAPLAVPDGIRLVHLPPYTPELQPAETLWVHVDAPIVNRHFDSLADLDAVVAERCVALGNDRDLVRGQAGFHWWPQRVAPN